MTKDQAVAFLTNAGHTTTVERLEDDDFNLIYFKHRGKRLTLVTCERDEPFLALRCSYRLASAEYDELAALRTLMRLQDDYKVVKFEFVAGEAGVTACAEQFVYEGESFDTVFWRSAELVTAAANHAAYQLDTTVAAQPAATRFIAALEAELQQPKPPRDAAD